MPSRRKSPEIQAAFDAKAGAWHDYTTTPLGQMRQQLTLYHLFAYLEALPTPLTILDAGAGTGGYSLALAKAGHRVQLLDLSQEMLAVAERLAADQGEQIASQLTYHVASVDEVSQLFTDQSLDLILCHTLLAYVSDPQTTISILARLLRPGGTLSLLCANWAADSLRWIWRKDDPDMARLALTEPTGSADLFGLPRRTFKPAEMHVMLDRAGLTVRQEHGIRIFADHVPNDKLAEPDYFERLFQLEVAASAYIEYNAIARYTHFIVQQTTC